MHPDYWVNYLHKLILFLPSKEEWPPRLQRIYVNAASGCFNRVSSNGASVGYQLSRPLNSDSVFARHD